MKITLPQVIMLNHAAWLERENADIRYKAKKAWDEREKIEDPVLEDFGGLKMSEITDDDTKLSAYLNDWSRFG
jgi:hypothetical protein